MNLEGSWHEKLTIFTHLSLPSQLTHFPLLSQLITHLSLPISRPLINDEGDIPTIDK